MQITRLIVTLLLVIGASVGIAIILLFPCSAVSQNSWEPLFRSYDDNIKAASKSHLIAALLDRYERYLRPFFSVSKGDPPLPAKRSEEYIITSELLKEMVNSYYSYSKMFIKQDSAYIFAAKNIKRPLSQLNDTKLPLIGKLILFSMPIATLLNKNETLNSTNEEIELNICWQTHLPGSPIAISFSNDYEKLAVAYRLIVPGGFQYRIRYYHDIKCDASYSENFTNDYYEKSLELTQKLESEYKETYDDIYIRAYGHIKALAIDHNKLFYSILQDTNTLHFLEKDTIKGKWIERQNTPQANREKNAYEFCQDLITIPNHELTLVAFTKRGSAFNRLNQEIDVYYLNLNETLLHLAGYRLETQTSLGYTTPNLETLPSTTPLFAINENKTLMFIVNSYDKSMLIHVPTQKSPMTFLQPITKWTNTQAIASLPDLSIIVLYPRDSNNIIFYINKNNMNTGTG